jgi:hypothetical protein
MMLFWALILRLMISSWTLVKQLMISSWKSVAADEIFLRIKSINQQLNLSSKH